MYNAKTPDPGAPPNQQLFRAQDVASVINIIIAEQGLPVRQFKSQFAKDDRKYTGVSSFDELGLYSKMYFVYIDLKKIASTGVLQNPKTELNYWCHFLWNAKDGNFNAESLDKYTNYASIQEDAKRLLRTPTKEVNAYHAKMSERETLKEEGRGEGREELIKYLLECLKKGETINKVKIT